MKCQNCGHNEANFHYTMNKNGAVTEKHYCTECAEKLAYSNGYFIETDKAFENMLSGFFGKSSIGISPLNRFNFAIPAMIWPNSGSGAGGGETPQAAPEKAAPKVAVDPEMQKRRELNVLKEQMNAAAQSEDFEKAAQIRDQIRELEKAEGDAQSQSV